VPKNGGTAIKGAAKTLEYNSNLVGMSRDAHACTWYHMPPQWMPNYGGYPLSNNKTTNTFVLARNPFHKAISQFRWSCWATPHIYPIAGDAVADKNPNKEILPGTPGYTGNSWVEFDPNLFVFKQPHSNKRRPRFPELNLNESIGCSNRRVTECAKPMQRLLSWHSSACQKNATLLNMYLEYAIPRFSQPNFIQKDFGEYPAFEYPGYAVPERKYNKDAKMTKDPADCHLVPQHIFAATAKHVFCTMKEVKQMFKEYGHNMTDPKVVRLREIGNKQQASEEAIQVLTDSNVKMIEHYYAKDFEFRGCSFPKLSAQ